MTDFSLTDYQILEQFRRETDEILVTNNLRDAVNCLTTLQKTMAYDTKIKDYPDILVEYNKILNKLRLVAFASLDWNEALSFLKNNFLVALENKEFIDLTDKIRSKLVTVPTLEERDNYRMRLRRALTQNGERITFKPLKVGDQTQDPTVANWLKLYLGSLGVELVNRVTYQGWLSQEQNIQQLTEEEKERIKYLFEVYEELKLSSVSVEGCEETFVIDEDTDTPLVLYRGKIESALPPQEDIDLLKKIEAVLSGKPVSLSAPTGAPSQPAVISAPIPAVAKPATSAIDRDEIIRKYEGDVKENRSIEDRMTQFTKTTGGKQRELANSLNLLLTGAAPDKLDIIAILYILAKKNAMEDLIKDDDRFYKLVEQDLTRRGGKQQLNDFKMYPTAPQSIRYFLEVLLQHKLRLSEGEAAKWGLHIVNILKKSGNEKYGKIAYFDLEAGDFRWQK
ncbi:MAG: hypothetical protein WC310_00790 [Patescibacteria group bacterium]|jgi:hypothetical protein